MLNPRWRPLASIGAESNPATIMVLGATAVCKERTHTKGSPRALSLFSGTRSVADELRRLGYEVTSLDVDPKSHANLVVDILQWDYQNSGFPMGYFDVIFASPPCEQYSQARTTVHRDLEQAGAIVEKTLEIIRYFKPRKWFLENPHWDSPKVEYGEQNQLGGGFAKGAQGLS